MRELTHRPTLIAPFVLLLVALALSGCARTTKTDLPTGQAAYAALESSPAVEEYRIAPLDLLQVTVFLEPELSNDALRVTATGMISLPLAGEVEARGLTTGELAAVLRQRLSAYLIDPAINVQLAESSGLRVTIEGEVNEPGVYPLSGQTGLLDLVAIAKGPTEVARLDQAIVLRRVNGQQYGAVFSLDDIRAGRVPDPLLRGGDQVVIGLDAVRENYRLILQAAPFANVFRVIN